MKIVYQYIAHKKLLIQKYSGKACHDTYKQHLERILKEPFSKDIRYVLSDLTEMEVDDVVKSVIQTSTSRNNKVTIPFKEVLLVTAPATTAFATLLQRIGSDNAVFHFCSTIEKAISLLNVSLTPDEVLMLLEDLRNKIQFTQSEN